MKKTESLNKKLIEEIKEKLDISSLLTLYHVKKGKGKNSYYCPFHEDKNPSFVADNEIGWKCLSNDSCGHGDIINFVRKIENYSSFKQALVKCAELAGIGIELNEVYSKKELKKLVNQRNQILPTEKKSAEIGENRLKVVNIEKCEIEYDENVNIENKLNEVYTSKDLKKEENQRNQILPTEKKSAKKAINELKQLHIDYLENRGINLETAEAFNLKARGNYILFPQQRNGHISGYKGINIKNKTMFFEGSDTKSKLWPDYHLEGIKTVIFTAGEYDTLMMNQKLKELHLNSYKAVTNSTGEGNYPYDLEEALKRFPDIEKFKIFYDNDDQGKKGAEKLAEVLHVLNKPVEIYQFPEDTPKGYDVSDFFNHGHNLEDLFSLKKTVYKPDMKSHFLKVPSLSERGDLGVRDNRITLDSFKFRVPDDYEVSKERGINKTTFTSKDEPRTELIAAEPVLITNRAINTDEKIIKLELAFRVSGIWEKYQVEREVISDSKKIITLSNFGFPVHSGNSRKVVQYLHAFEKANDDFLETIYLTHNNGWKDFNNKKIFGLGTNIIGLDSSANIAFSPEPGFERFTKSLNTHGTYEKWKETIKPIMDHNKVAFALYASLAAPLLNLVDAPSFLIHYWGDSSMGKTTALEVAASVWGNPAKETGGLVTSWNNTQVFVERIATFFDDLPLFLDDSQTADDKTISNIVYMVANSTGKGRGAKVAGVKHTSSWQTVCFSTGEKQLTESTQYDGARARTIEMAGSPFGRNEGKLVNNVKSGVRENYGFAGEKFINYLLEFLNKPEGIEELKEIYRNNRDLLSTKARNEIGDRLAHYFAVIWLAAYLAEEHLKIGGNPGKVVESIFLETISERHSEGDIATRALQDVISFAQANMKSFLGKSDETIKEHFGIWKEAEYIAFYPHKLKDFLGKNGFSYNSILRSWSDRDWIRRSKEGYSYPFYYGNNQYRMIVIKWETVSQTY